ncbi:MAG: CBS domain-containing protein [Caulobacteraceae bacterium]
MALEVSTPLAAVVAEFVDSEHSRLPIYRETLDDPIGFVHIKDVFKLIAGKMPAPEPDEAVLGRLRRETLYVPASMRAADLLVRMQARHIHLAMVIDEFGGVDGLVSMEDVIESVVGEIDDEHDVAAAGPDRRRPDGAYEVAGRTELADIEAAIGPRAADARPGRRDRHHRRPGRRGRRPGAPARRDHLAQPRPRGRGHRRRPRDASSVCGCGR